MTTDFLHQCPKPKQKFKFNSCKLEIDVFKQEKRVKSVECFVSVKAVIGFGAIYYYFFVERGSESCFESARYLKVFRDALRGGLKCQVAERVPTKHRVMSPFLTSPIESA